MKRRKMDRSSSERYFTNTARYAHPKNLKQGSPRGGYRL